MRTLCRDLGGYKTKEGRTIKWGKIYRSAAINLLTDYDLVKLQKLSIAYDLDFRGPYEVATAQDKITSNITRISLPAGSEQTGNSESYKKMFDTTQKENPMLKFYIDLTPFEARYKPMFQQLLKLPKDSALLFHCTAGKDRTGIAAALLLSALGVDENIILADYEATNYYRASDNARMINMMVKTYHLNQEKATQMMAADPSYLQATLDAIKNKYGTIDNYLQTTMRIGKKEKKLLRRKFTN